MWKRRSCRELADDSRRLGGAVERVTIRHRGGGRDRVRIERAGGGTYRVFLDIHDLSSLDRRWVPKSRLPPLLALFSRTKPALAAIEADMSDGERGRAGIVSFCANTDEAILVPDSEFIQTGGYQRFRLRFDPADAWAQRSDIVRWRGTTTGHGGDVSNETMDPDTLIPRVAMCLKLRGVQGVDAKIANVAQTEQQALAEERFRRAGILGEWITPMAWLGSRYAIDIDGNSNAWSNLFTRLLLGNCVIKVASRTGHRQWYYDRLQPGVHYVPVRSDMSDLVEQIAWARSNPEACLEIARAGHALAQSMTVESETRDAIARLNALA